MDPEIIVGYIGTAIGAGGITQLFNWRINKKKAKEDVKSDEIENIRKSIDIYQTIISDQNKRINELTDEVKQLRLEKVEMEKHYQAQILTLQKQIVEINRVLGISARKAIRDENTGKYKKADKSQDHKK